MQVGRGVWRDFGEAGVHRGVVTHHWEDSGLYHVRYEDNDEEDMTLDEIEHHSLPVIPDGMTPTNDTTVWSTALRGICGVMAINWERGLALCQFDPPGEVRRNIHRMSDRRLAKALVAAQATLTLPDNDANWRRLSPGIHRLRCVGSECKRGQWSVQTVVTQAPQLNDIGKSVDPLPVTARSRAGGVRGLLRGEDLWPNLTRAPEWLPMSLLGARGAPPYHPRAVLETLQLHPALQSWKGRGEGAELEPPRRRRRVHPTDDDARRLPTLRDREDEALLPPWEEGAAGEDEARAPVGDEQTWIQAARVCQQADDSQLETESRETEEGGRPSWRQRPARGTEGLDAGVDGLGAGLDATEGDERTVTGAGSAGVDPAMERLFRTQVRTLFPSFHLALERDRSRGPQ